MTASEIILAAFRLIGSSRVGQVPATAMTAEGLSTLNGMIDQWSIERLTVPVIVRRVLPLTVGQQAYTMGLTGDWNVPRPVRIERAGIIITTNPPQPVELPITILSVQGWSNIVIKATQSTIPTALYNDGSYPLTNISMWPVPQDSSNYVALYCWEQISSFADLSTTSYDFPPGYVLALKYNLAALLMPLYVIQNKSNMQQWQMIIDQAATLKGSIKAFNAPLTVLKPDAALTSTAAKFNWLTGDTV